MANYSGNQYQAGVGIRDHSAQALGSGTTSVDAYTEMKLTTVNDIVWSGAFQTATVAKSGRRAYLNQDYISTYGAGVWTWDFDYLADDQLVCQKLLSLINPVTGGGNTCGTLCTIASNPLVNDLSKGAAGTFDTTGDILILAPIIPASGGVEDQDRLMQSSVLQNLTIACDVGTDGGRPHMTQS